MHIFVNQRKDGQTYCNSSSNTNHAIITEYKLRGAKVLNLYGSLLVDNWIVVVGDKGAIADMRYKVYGVFSW